MIIKYILKKLYLYRYEIIYVYLVICIIFVCCLFIEFIGNILCIYGFVIILNKLVFILDFWFKG